MSDDATAAVSLATAADSSMHDSYTPAASTAPITANSARGSPPQPAAAAERTRSSSPSRSDNNHHRKGSLPVGHVPPVDELDAEIATLNAALRQTSAEAAQAVLRRHWRIFLFNKSSDDHISFILRAGLKNASSIVIEHVLKEDGPFKERLFEAAVKKQHVIQRVLGDVTSDQIARHVPKAILDQAISDRLKNAPAKDLVKWLAQADRLGYSLDDVLDEEDESVRPNVPHSGHPQTQDKDVDAEMIGDANHPRGHVHPDLPLLLRDPLLAEQERNVAAIREERRVLKERSNLLNSTRSLTCGMCYHQFTSPSGYNYHVAKRICRKQPPSTGWKWSCSSCAQGFTTKQGMNYHQLKKVCEGDAIAPPTSPAPVQRRLEAAPTELISLPRISPDQILPPIRPTFAFQAGQRPNLNSSVLQVAGNHQQRPAMGPIPSPPVHTPLATPRNTLDRERLSSPEIRRSPSELPALKLAELNRELAKSDRRYQAGVDEIPAYFSQEERAARLTSLKNGNASRKSQIRRSFGVSLRLRDKDKATTTSSTNGPRLAQYRAGYGANPSATSDTSVRNGVPNTDIPRSSPSSSFVAINAPRPAENNYMVPPPRGFSPPGLASADQSRRIHRLSDSSTLDNTHDTRDKDFGVKLPEIRSSYHERDFAVSSILQHPNKRRRMSDEEERHSASSHMAPSPPQMRDRVEDVVKRTSAGVAQSKWDAFPPRRSPGRELISSRPNAKLGAEESPTAVPQVAATTGASKNAAINIVSSSESDGVERNGDHRDNSTDGEGDERFRRRTSSSPNRHTYQDGSRGRNMNMEPRQGASDGLSGIGLLAGAEASKNMRPEAMMGLLTSA